MRKVTFYIDDLAFFRKSYNMTDRQIKDIFQNDSFKVIYTLYGDNNEVDHYTLTDYDGNKVDYNSLNGYQRGVVLNDCYAYFVGGKYHSNAEEPCGVMQIGESIYSR